MVDAVPDADPDGALRRSCSWRCRGADDGALALDNDGAAGGL